MHHYFARLFRYNYDTNRQLIHFLDEHSIDEAQINTWLSHVLNAHFIWIARLQGTPSPYTVWQEHPKSELPLLNQQVHEETEHFLNTTEDLSPRISYQNSQGHAYVNRTDDVLWHIINHSTHHRAQISTLIRQRGLTPEPMDFIFYVRDKD